MAGLARPHANGRRPRVAGFTVWDLGGLGFRAEGLGLVSGGTFFGGIPIVMTIVFWRLYWGPPIYGHYTGLGFKAFQVWG